MRILTVFDYPNYHGGVNRVLSLSRGLQKEGHKVLLVGVAFDKNIPFWRYRAVDEEVEGVKVVRFYANHLIPFLLLQLLFLRRVLRKNPVDIIQAYNTTYITCLAPLILKFLNNTKFVVIYDDISPMVLELGLVHRRAMVFFEKYVCLLADKIVVLTNIQKNYLQKKGIREERIIRIPNFVDRETLNLRPEKGEEIRRGLGIHRETILGYVGTLDERCSLENVVQVLPELVKEKVHFLVVGDGNALEKLKELVKETGIRNMVTFVGRVPHAEVGKYYSAMDILLCPLENSPLNMASDHIKLYEYLATGRPVIAARVGSVKDVIIDGKNGLLYNLERAGELVSKILFLTEHPKKAKELGAEGRKTIFEKHDFKRVFGLWREMYRELCRKRVADDEAI